MSTPKKKPAFLEIRLEKGGVKLRQSDRQIPAQPQPPMIRLRFPSEKPTREDAGDDGYVFAFVRNIAGKTLCCSMVWNHDWVQHSPAISLVAWLPGRLPDGILPREPSQEEKWQAEFSEWWTKTGHTDHNGLIADAAWAGFLAAKKGGAE